MVADAIRADQPSPRPPVILVIDDNRGDLDLVSEAFAAVDEALVVVAVENVPQAFSYLRGVGPYTSVPQPDLIIVDLNMPVFTGHDFLRDLRNHERWRHIPTLVFSTSRRDADKQLALKLGASRFVTKPLDWTEYVTFAKTIACEVRKRG